MSNENSRNVFPSEYCCHLIDFAKLAKIHKFRFANYWFDSPMATWRTLTGTLKSIARKLPRCGTGARAKSTYCDLSSFGPALFEIWWPDIYLGGPYGPVKDKMYWPELVQRSEKCPGPAGQCLCRGLQQCNNIMAREDGFTSRQLNKWELDTLQISLRC